VKPAVRIHGIAAGGDGVGTLADGRVVFVPRAAPGDLLELKQVVPSRRFARARIARVMEASPDRVTPPCPHYQGDECGGCQLQHLSAPAQRLARSRLVGDALRRIGHLPVEDPDLIPSETEWEYRSRVTLAVAFPGRGSREPRIGFHRFDRPSQTFELTRCPIARPEVNDLWTAFRDHRAKLPRNTERLILRIDRTGGRHAIVKTTGTDSWPRARELGTSLATAGCAVTLWWQPEGGAARVLFGSSDPYPATVFEQIHPEMGDRVRAYAVGELGDTGGCHVWDLYAGIGETTRRITPFGNRQSAVPTTVESVELDARAVRLAEERGPEDGITRHAGRVEDLIDRLRPAHRVIVNPPRTGLASEVTDRLAARPPNRLVYVSCDPATLARDVSRLATSFRLCRIQAFDLFPQTAHIETVATLEPV
jgi:23S rRNA (uracil1939-C5)-methyltransferase